MDSFYTQSATQLAKAIASKKISSVELVTACIEQIHRVNPKLNAVVQFNPDQALHEAKQKDHMLSKGKALGPLHGIPFTLKDVYNTKGDLVTAGCLGLKDNRADSDATIVTRLKQAGAILLGKTNTPELENAGDTDNLVYGRTSNPYDQEYSSGGSSGGAAAIVSAAASVFDIGADTGGSLRLPAHYCGIATIRPTVHRIPTSGVVYGLRTGMGGAFTTEGPLSRYVEDLPLLLSILNGPDGIDPNTVASPLGNSADVNLSQLNMAYFDQNSIIDTCDETKQAIKMAADTLSACGANVRHDKPEQIEDGCRHFQEVLGANVVAGMRQALDDMQVEQVSRLLENLLSHLDDYTCDISTFMQRYDQWEFYRSRILQFFNNYDVLLSPVTPGAALPHATPMWNPDMIDHASYTWTISATLLPVTVVRVGSAANGLPIGIQIITKPYHEHVGIAVAQQLEASLGGWQMPNL